MVRNAKGIRSSILGKFSGGGDCVQQNVCSRVLFSIGRMALAVRVNGIRFYRPSVAGLAASAILAFLCVGQIWSRPQNPGGRQTAPIAQSTDATDQLPRQVDQMKHQLADWAQLDRYRAENAAVAPAVAGERRVVFYGDSITDFWGRKTGRFFPGKPYINRGIWGQTTPQLLVRFQQDVVHLRPSAVVILAGTNDIAGNTGPSTPQMIEDNFASMAAIAKQNGIKLIIASILPANHYYWSPAVNPVEEIRIVNAWLEHFCAQNNLTYLNYYDSMSDSKGGMRARLSSDGVHPTAQGYEVMAPLAEEAIIEAFEK